MILARCCHSVNVVALCVTCDNVRGGECPSWYWWWSVLGTGDTGDHRWPGGGGTWGHSHMVTGPPGAWRDHTLHTEQLTPLASPLTATESQNTHSGCNVSVITLCRWLVLAGYAWLCIAKMYKCRDIHILCVWNWKVSLVICNWNLAYFLIRILHHSSNF